MSITPTLRTTGEAAAPAGLRLLQSDAAAGLLLVAWWGVAGPK